MNDKPTPEPTRRVPDDFGRGVKEAMADLRKAGLPTIFSFRQAYYTGADAQAKKIAEWGNKPCPHYPGSGLNRVKHECGACWQKLLEGGIGG